MKEKNDETMQSLFARALLIKLRIAGIISTKAYEIALENCLAKFN